MVNKLKEAQLNAEYLRSLLDYDAATGLFRWRYNPAREQKWNTKHAGKIAGSNNRGYIFIRIEGALYPAHRLAWLYVTGEWPAHVIDHRSGNQTDNRFCP